MEHKLDARSLFKNLVESSEDLRQEFVEIAFEILNDDFNKAREDRLKLFADVKR